MRHLTDLETIALPEEFGQALLGGASCEAVLVESTGPAEPAEPAEPSEPSESADRLRRPAWRQSVVAVFRVGEGVVVEIADREERARTVGLDPAAAEEFVDRVRRDGDWTVFAVGDAPAANPQDGIGAGTAPER